jgi:uncharacterized protein YuzE
MESVRITYDPDGDILYITFGQARSATGYKLSDQLLLRVDPKTSKAAGLTIFNYSLHMHAGAELTLSGLTAAPQAQALLLPILTASPVSHFLSVRQQQGRVRARLLSPSLQEAVVG